jgi:H/ACA ribonucleoprotein complex subunit 1
MGKFVHDVENEMFCESINTKIPYFNAPIYLENKVPTSPFLEVMLQTRAIADRSADTHWESR